MRIDLGRNFGVSMKALIGVQLVLLASTAAFVLFLYGQVGPLLRQRSELQAGVQQLRNETGALQQNREALQAQKQSLEAERDRLRSEIARLNDDRTVLSESVRTLSAGTDRAEQVLEYAAREYPRSLSPRIYVHVASESSAERARALVKNLEDAGYIVPSVQRVRAVPARPQLRFFSADDKNTAQRAFDIARRVIPDLELRPFGPDDAPNIRRQVTRPGHLEIWF